VLAGVLGIHLSPLTDQAIAGDVEIQPDIAYYSGPGASPTYHRLDFYLPAGTIDYPLVVFAHGGGWTSGDRRNHANVGQALAARGIGVALVDYRLSDGGLYHVTHPGHAEDVARAVAFVRAYLTARHAAAADVFLMGHGAGAHLAALVATHPGLLAAQGLAPADVRGVVGLSGTYTINPSGRDHAKVFGLDPAARRDASPRHQASGEDPPFLLLVGASDINGRAAEARTFGEALGRAGVSATIAEVPGRDFDAMAGAVGQPGDPTTEWIVWFVQEHRRSASPPEASPSPAPTATATPAPVAPPVQPRTGPGGAARTHGGIRASTSGLGGAAGWVFEPAEPAPDAEAPVVVFLPEAGVADRGAYGAWLAHLARGGSVVVFPTGWATIAGDAGARLDGAAEAVRGALSDLEGDPRRVRPDLERVSYAGHGEGAAMAARLASGWFGRRLPPPRSLMLMMPRDPFGALGGSVDDLDRLPRDARALFVAVDGPGEYADAAEIALWDGTAHLPRAWRERLVLTSDRYGTPALVADSDAPRGGEPADAEASAGDLAGTLDALDWYGPWKWLDALAACTYRGADCAYAFGGTPEQLGMGAWADGRAVSPARLSEGGPPRPGRWLRWLPLVAKNRSRPREG